MPEIIVFDATPESQVMLKWLQYQKGNSLKVANYCDRIAEALEILEEVCYGHEPAEKGFDD